MCNFFYKNLTLISHVQSVSRKVHNFFSAWETKRDYFSLHRSSITIYKRNERRNFSFLCFYVCITLNNNKFICLKCSKKEINHKPYVFFFGFKFSTPIRTKNSSTKKLLLNNNPNFTNYLIMNCSSELVLKKKRKNKSYWGLKWTR